MLKLVQCTRYFKRGPENALETAKESFAMLVTEKELRSMLRSGQSELPIVEKGADRIVVVEQSDVDPATEAAIPLASLPQINELLKKAALATYYMGTSDGHFQAVMDH